MKEHGNSGNCPIHLNLTAPRGGIICRMLEASIRVGLMTVGEDLEVPAVFSSILDFSLL